MGWVLIGITLLFAAEGMLLTAAFLAVKYHLTKVAGRIDLNDRYFQKLSHREGHADPVAATDRVLLRLSILNEVHPLNAKLILAAFGQHRDPLLAERMLDALDPYLTMDPRYQDRLQRLEAFLGTVGPQGRGGNLFPWLASEEWTAFRGGVAKDRDTLCKAAKAAGVEPRLIVTMMVSEQIRLFNARRESFKRFFAPLKILGNETKFSLGVCGIKDDTAKAIEANLKSPASPFYLGKACEHLLDYPADPAAPPVADQRFLRLVDHSHYWSYLYTGLFIRQVIAQWQAAGYNLAGRPEILATLFNLGFVHSQPGPDPHVGGADLTIGGRSYTFGSLAFEFYYSGDLSDSFPFAPKAQEAAPTLVANLQP